MTVNGLAHARQVTLHIHMENWVNYTMPQKVEMSYPQVKKLKYFRGMLLTRREQQPKKPSKLIVSKNRLGS